MGVQFHAFRCNPCFILFFNLEVAEYRQEISDDQMTMDQEVAMAQEWLIHMLETLHEQKMPLTVKSLRLVRMLGNVKPPFLICITT